MMRKILTLLTLLLLPLPSSLFPLPSSLLPLHAQQVWTVGSCWEVEYTAQSGQGTVVYTLEDAVDLEGIAYFPLTESSPASEKKETLAFIRAERGDTLVFVRYSIGSSIGKEQLLYDFSKSFEYGDVITYGTMDGPRQMLVDPDLGTLDYYYDVLEEGDCLPAWGSLIYKLGCIDGPLALYLSGNGYDGDVDPTDPIDPVDPVDPGTTEEDKPKSSNVSHTLFKRKGGGGCMIVPTPDGIRVIEFDEEPSAYYDLSGRICPEALEGKVPHGSAPHSFYIYKGRKHIK